MLGKTSKTLDTIDVIFGFRVHPIFRMIRSMMLPQYFQRIVTLERICVVTFE